MKHSLGMTCRLAGIVALALLPIFTAMADDKYVKSEEPVFPAVQPDDALVYFARPAFGRLIPLPTFKVFVDGTPAGWLPQRSYLAAQVEPGHRLVWGPRGSSPQWFEFTAGTTYLLVFVEQFDIDTNNTRYAIQWTTGDPADIQGLVAARKLSYVKPTEEGIAKLHEEVVKEYEKVRKRSVVQPTPVFSTPQPTTAHVLPEEQLAVNFDQRKWHFGYETEKGGQRIKEFVLPEETVDNWTELVTVQSFLGAQKTAEEVVLGMKQRLNACPKAMWKIIQGDKDEFVYEWQTVDCPGWDNQYEVSKVIKGRTAIHHIAYANRKLPVAEETRRQWIDLIAKAGFQTLGSAAQSTPTPSPPQSAPSPSSAQPKTADTLPEGFVLYEGFKDQFTIAIPEGWAAYDQELGGIITFLPAPVAQKMNYQIPPGSDAKELARKALKELNKVETGEIPSFLVERVRADRGMSCSGFSEKAEKKLLQTIGRDRIFGKGRNVPERPHADPTTVGECKGLRFRGRGQTSGGAESVVDIYAASDAQTLYLFTLRPLAENYAKNLGLFEKAVSTLKFSAAK